MIDEILKTIATQGILGIFLVLALVAIVYLYKELAREKAARIDDLKSILQTDIKYKVELKGLLDTILEILRNRK